MAVMPSMYAPNDGSIWMMSGSGYVSGSDPGPHCRGGLLMTLGGVPFSACASAAVGTSAAAPATNATVLMSVRREIGPVSGDELLSVCVIYVPSHPAYALRRLLR